MKNWNQLIDMVENIKSSDTNTRIKAVKALGDIAISISPERVVTQILPFA